MKLKNIDDKLNQITDLIDSINELCQNISNNKFSFFDKCSISIINKTNYESTFIKLVSWFYSLFREVSKNNIKFIRDKFLVYNISSNDCVKRIVFLRTYLQHNLKEDNKDDIVKINYCINWFEEIINKNKPSSVLHWRILLFELTDECILYLTSIKECLREIKKDTFLDIIREDWVKHNYFCFTINDFEVLCFKITREYGMDKLDCNLFCKRNFQNWSKILSCLTIGYNFDTEATILIENALFKIEIPILNGNDIADILKIQKGPIVGEMLKFAINSHKEKPCTKSELLIRVYEKYNSTFKSTNT